MMRYVAMVLALPACMVRFPSPYTANQLAADSQRYPARALAHYLMQEGAKPEVCDLHAVTHTAAVDVEVAESLLEHVETAAIAPSTFSACLLHALGSVPPRAGGAILSKVAQRFAALLGTDKPSATVYALHEVLTRRPREVRPSQKASAALTAAVARMEGEGRPGPTLALARDLAQLFEIERGQWQGQPVTPPTFDAIDELDLLRRFARWSPDESLRRAAKRRIIRLRIAASTFAEVRERPDSIEAVVLEHGRNRVALEQTRVVRATSRVGDELASRGVLVRQNVHQQRAALFARNSGVAALAPSVELRGRLWFELVGVSKPVTLCGPVHDLDPDPCVDAGQLKLDSEVARLSRDGVLHFREELPLAEAAALLTERSELTLRWTFRGREVVRIDVPIGFETPTGLVLHGDTGRAGPRLEVEITAIRDWLMVWTEDQSLGSRPRRVAVVARDQASKFKVVSRGGHGIAGSPGAQGNKGNRGNNGNNATCPSSPGGRGGNGGQGGRGGDGGKGGAGGDGGNVRVRVKCEQPCPELVALARRMVQSQGGPGGNGGAGGAGGPGGDGGRGGSGTSCRDYHTGQTRFLSSGSNGSQGAAGPSGNNGAPGKDGRPGRVTVTRATE